MADEQDRAELLDDDKVSDDFPPEQPLAVEDFGTTPAEELYGEPLAERLAREEPEGPASAEGGVRLVQPDEGAHTDTEASEVAVLDVDDPDLPGASDALRDTATESESG